MKISYKDLSDDLNTVLEAQKSDPLEKYSVDIVASGGVSTIFDVEELRKMELYGAIIGKAYYTGAIDLEKAIEVAK